MHDAARLLLLAVAIGAGATLAMDLWGLAQKHWLGMKPLDYGMVGRWLGHMPRGRFRHEAIGQAPAIPAERLIGWTAHYVTGIAFAAVLLAVWGPQWACRPTIGPALIVGLASVVFPFLLMQPGMGAGIAARRTPKPGVARLRSVVTHGVFGLGLYASARLMLVLNGALAGSQIGLPGFCGA
ncbi:DUF2938 domain-containing protein [Cupriavidus cauae]|uniref:DUF2938 domain-containing protein n=1 Tax=Cupriavidus cauae TaxID=2608999 RepID=A0A5M8AB15_9BURK|nr:DUF2938 domain-containing protein [Cupriavidus cauae]KAA6120988.1 DUF2938 domain-containing protein [Cupriavidus cauae]